MGLVVSNFEEILDVTSMDLHFSLLLKAVVEPLGLDQLLNGWYRLKATERVWAVIQVCMHAQGGSWTPI